MIECLSANALYFASADIAALPMNNDVLPRNMFVGCWQYGLHRFLPLPPNIKQFLFIT